MKKVVFLLILIQSLCLLQAAYGGDSWVLWEKQESIDSSVGIRQAVMWEAIDGYAKEADCRTHREQVWNGKMKDWGGRRGSYIEKIDGVPYTYIGIKTKDSLVTLQYYCLPGTIDPREHH
ncbi:MAG: hypothetical protein ABSE08_00745 [Syntrophobacteraceae bacterium]|jgi:hypothetical protein